MQNWKQKANEHKRWCDILAPETFGGEKIGSTIIRQDDDLIGNTVRTSLGELSDTEPKRNGRIVFEVTNVDGEESYTELLQYEMPQAERNLATNNGAVVVSMDGMETNDGYILEGNIVLRRPARWDTESLLDVIHKSMAKSEMPDVLQSLMNASFTHNIESRGIPEVEFESLVVTKRPHGPKPDPSIERATN